jgi:hypothetical protein
MDPILEDYSDLAGEEEEVNLQQKVANFKVRGLISPLRKASLVNIVDPDQKLASKRALPSG